MNHKEIVFMLRCWKEKDQEQWRFGMKNIKTGDSKFLTSIQELEKYINSLEKTPTELNSFANGEE